MASTSRAGALSARTHASSLSALAVANSGSNLCCSLRETTRTRYRSVQSLAGDGTISGSHATSTGLTFHDGSILGKSLCIRRGQRRDGTCEQVHAPAARLPHEQVGCPARGWFSTAARSQLQWPAEVLPQLHLGFSTADYMLIHSPQQRGNYSLAVAVASGFLAARTFDACGRRRDRRALCGEVNGN